MQKAIDAVVSGYLAAVNWTETHPHKTIWLGLAVVVLALVF